jgi:3-deoxy-D-manno-octulosonic-acid transferase
MVANRSKNQEINDNVNIYIADTMGELGIFYRLAKIVFIGGTLVPHGGQNALEPARIGCAIITAKHYHNFISVIDDMAIDDAIIKIQTQQELYEAVKELLNNEVKINDLADSALNHAKSKNGAIDKIISRLHLY